MLENIPVDEQKQIQHIVELTRQQLQRRYPGQDKVLRGVHAKAHGCVTATFEVVPGIPENLRHGVFAEPGKSYPAMVRFSNASVAVEADSTSGANGNPPIHGSRGMAIKLMGVEGVTLEPVHGEATQDFLMINQPVFAFANVEDYEALSQILVDHNDKPEQFFQRLPAVGTAAQTPAQKGAVRTREVIARIRSASMTADSKAFQAPPASPIDNDYFSASPFLLGPDQVMRFRVCPQSRSADEPDVTDPDYLRNALAKRLRDQQAGNVVFHFEVQVRPASSINPDVDIENASYDWPETSEYQFRHVATLTIPLQEFDSTEFRERCERLFFTPWHGLAVHRPLGGINRLRRAVYDASVTFRNLPKEPAATN